jgi:ribosomal protein S12 methylthiotransferase
MPIYAHITSLGCPKNLVDSEIIAGVLIKNRIGIANSPRNADVMIINSCAFIASARNESEFHIRSALNWRRKKDERKIVLCGCLNQWDPKAENLQLIREVDLRIGIDEIEKIAEKILSLYGEKKLDGAINKLPSYLQTTATPRLQLTPAHYAYIKISDGCSNKCSYCSIPAIRGEHRSRRQNDILSETLNLLSNGSKEIILTAQDSARYGSDLAGYKPGIVSLIRKMDAIDCGHEFWIRLMYCHPRHITPELIDCFRNAKHLLPYLDLPLQHISDKILKAMNRKVSSSLIKKILEEFRTIKPHIAVRTTFITGFPGETDKDFEELLSFIRETKFDRLGAFKYSPEKGTRAFSLPSQVPDSVAEARLKLLMETQKKISLELNQKMLGRKIKTIVDSRKGQNTYIARTPYDAPQIDNTVLIQSNKKITPGTIITVKITSAMPYSLNAKPLS